MDTVLKLRNEKYTAGLKALIDELDISNGVMVEIGSYAGESAVLFAQSNKFSDIICIDPWQNGYGQGDGWKNMSAVEQAFDDNVKPYENVRKFRGTIDTFINSGEYSGIKGKVDFVYIDGDHSYDSVINDIRKTMQYLSPSCAIAGHDYDRPGEYVCRAVDEYFKKPDKIYDDTSWIKKLPSPKSIAVCWIGIGAYNVLFGSFYESFAEKFCPECKRTFFIFTDQPERYSQFQDCVVYAVSHAQTHIGFVLFRKFKYLMMAEDKFPDFDYVAFMNGNMFCNRLVRLCDIVDDSRPITGVSHPCMPPDQNYLQAGVFVSKSFEFLKMANTIEGWRHLDKSTGKDAEIPWHDETYFNRYYRENAAKFNVLDGRVWMCPGDLSDTKESILYARDKKTALGNGFAPVIHSDYYVINETSSAFGRPAIISP